MDCQARHAARTTDKAKHYPYHIPPVPERETSPSWRHLMAHYKDQLVACDFFTVETLFLQTIYVLAFIEIGRRRVHFAGCTTHPNCVWVEQQARKLCGS